MASPPIYEMHGEYSQLHTLTMLRTIQRPDFRCDQNSPSTPSRGDPPHSAAHSSNVLEARV